MSINIYGVGKINEQDLKIENGKSLNGLYKYKTRGSSGDIYVNDLNTIAIKVNHQPQLEEVNKQMKVKSLAPEIYYHKYPYTIHMKETDDIPDQYENIGIIVMEYLNEDKWEQYPRNSNDKQMDALFNVLYKLVTVYKFKNLSDIMGISGPHIFITKKEPYNIKIIDYDNFNKCSGSKKDFLDMALYIASSTSSNRMKYKAGEFALQMFKKTKKTKQTKQTKNKKIKKTKKIISKTKNKIKKKTKKIGKTKTKISKKVKEKVKVKVKEEVKEEEEIQKEKVLYGDLKDFTINKNRLTDKEITDYIKNDRFLNNDAFNFSNITGLNIGYHILIYSKNSIGITFYITDKKTELNKIEYYLNTSIAQIQTYINEDNEFQITQLDVSEDHRGKKYAQFLIYISLLYAQILHGTTIKKAILDDDTSRNDREPGGCPSDQSKNIYCKMGFKYEDDDGNEMIGDIDKLIKKNKDIFTNKRKRSGSKTKKKMIKKEDPLERIKPKKLRIRN